MKREPLTRLLVRAWLATAIVDRLFASALSVVGYHSTTTRPWQGVPATLLGPAAFEGGAHTALSRGSADGGSSETRGRFKQRRPS